jgi:hypothetical protein
MIENKKMDFERSHVDKDGKHDQTSDSRPPVPKLGSL